MEGRQTRLVGGRLTPMRGYSLITALSLFAAVSSGCATRHPEFTTANVATLQPGVTTEDQARALFGPPDQVEATTMGQGSEKGPWQALILSYRMGVEDPQWQFGIEAVNRLIFQQAYSPPILNSYEVPIIWPRQRHIRAFAQQIRATILPQLE